MMQMHFGMRGLNGLGSVDWSTCDRVGTSPDNTVIECIDANNNVIATTPTPGGGTSAGSNVPSTDQSSWWSTALTALVKGTTQAIVGPGASALPSCAVVPVGTPCIPVAAPTPWYSTPLGMLGIAVAVIGGGFLLLKK